MPLEIQISMRWILFVKLNSAEVDKGPFSAMDGRITYHAAGDCSQELNSLFYTKYSPFLGT